MLAEHEHKPQTKTPVELKLVPEMPPPVPVSRPLQETHYLLRCHRIALDFGPRAAQRALALYGNGEHGPGES